MYFYTMFGSSEGVQVRYGDLSFTIPAQDALRLFELVDGVRSLYNIPTERLDCKADSLPDDLTEDVYVGMRYFRYAGYRIPIKKEMGEFGSGLDYLHMTLSVAMEGAEKQRMTEAAKHSAEAAHQLIIKELELDLP